MLDSRYIAAGLHFDEVFFLLSTWDGNSSTGGGEASKQQDLPPLSLPEEAEDGKEKALSFHRQPTRKPQP